jgi:hypothetical protein
MANPKTSENEPLAPARMANLNPKPPETEPLASAPNELEPPAAPPPPTQAVVITTVDGTLCRPPVGVGLHTLGHVVIGNWFGHVDGKPVTVEHGTPVRGLPQAVAKKIRETPEQRVGPYDARKRKTQAQAGV